MKKLRTIIAGAMLVFILVAIGKMPADAQDTTSQDQSGAVPAATGPDTETQTIENPPLSGLDQPSFAPGFGARSYLVPRLEGSEAVDTNRTGKLGNNTSIKGVTRGLGSLTLQKLWKLHPLNVDYSGGVAWYQGLDKVYQMHSMSAVQRFLWRTGQLAVRDSFSYLPTGSFGFNSFGGSGGLNGGGGIAGGGLGGGFGGGIGGGGIGNTNFGSTVNQPRISNMSVVDITQALSPRNTVTLAGGYGINDYLSNPTGYVNSQMITGQAGFDHKLTRQDRIALLYIYQDFHFPRQGAGSFNDNSWQVIYGHRLTGKLDLQVGAGPQWLHRYFWRTTILPGPPPSIVTVPATNSSLSGSGRATLNYAYSSRTNLNLYYTHSTNAGSGLLTGASSDAIRLAMSHSLTRRWTMTMDTGYSYSKRILNSPTAQAGNASAYRYWYAGGALRRQLSRHVGAFASYQYDAIGFARGICSTQPGSSCNTGYGRHVGLIGLDWTPSPIRLE